MPASKVLTGELRWSWRRAMEGHWRGALAEEATGIATRLVDGRIGSL